MDEGYDAETAAEMAELAEEDTTEGSTPLVVAIKQIVKFGDPFNIDMFDEAMQTKMQRTLTRLVAKTRGEELPGEEKRRTRANLASDYSPLFASTMWWLGELSSLARTLISASCYGGTKSFTMLVLCVGGGISTF